MKQYKNLKPNKNESFAAFVLRTWDKVDSKDKEKFFKQFDPKPGGRDFGAYAQIKFKRNLSNEYEVVEERPNNLPNTAAQALSERMTVTIAKNHTIRGNFEAAVFGGTITTLDMFNRLDLDPRFYEMVEWKATTWDIKKGSEFQKMTGIKFAVRPKEGINIGKEELKLILEEIRANIKPIKFPKAINAPKTDVNKLVEIPLTDAHLNKMAEAEISGQEVNTADTATRISKIFDTVVKEHSDAHTIAISIGQDFFNIDNIAKMTTAGTPQDTHMAYETMFRFGFDLMIEQINKISFAKKIIIKYVEGNHDKLASWHLTMLLDAVFKGNANIEVDTSSVKRKYIQWGINMICWTHGDKERKNLPFLMQTEQPQMWAETKIREIHAGHFHTLSTQEQGGVVIRRLSSISGTDRWHHDNGYNSSRQAAQIFIWDKEEGLKIIREISF